MNEFCFCGAGAYDKGKRITWVSHAPDCLWLAWVVTLREDGYCSTCGEKVKKRKSRGCVLKRCATCGWIEAEWSAS